MKPEKNSTKKVVINYSEEFGPELQLVIPYAYFLHKKDLLGKTVSALDTKAFYFFSKEHEEKYDHRSWLPITHSEKAALPNKSEHTFYLKTSEYLPPPYKEYYKNNRFKWTKEPLVISNKYCTEWNKSSFNYLDCSTLEEIIKMLKNKYQIIYCRPTGNKDIVPDDNPIQPFEDFELINNHPEVLTIQKLHINNPDLSFNTLQLMVFANCNKFISVQGGNSVLASYFGGTNIIYILQGQELSCGDYNHFSLYCKTRICPCFNYETLLKCINQTYIVGRNRKSIFNKTKIIFFIQFSKYNISFLWALIKKLQRFILFRHRTST